jgi:phosphoglycerol transferase MdoB-like AlkP superfamily enzyme
VRFAAASLPLIALVLAAPRPAAAAPALAWQVVRQDTPHILWADRNADVRFALRNAGTATWSESAGDHLSYHWLNPNGEVVQRDGMRTQFAAPVKPGETVEVTARVHAPARAGRWVLEWEMVREGVAWYGPPEGGVPLRIPIRVVFRCGLLQIGFAVLTLALVLGARLLRPHLGPRSALVLEAVPVVWAWAGTVLVTVTFSELVGWQLWTGAGVRVASAAALLALPVALVPGRFRAWAAGILVAAASGVAFADAVYVRFFGSIVPVVAMAAVRQVGRVEGSVAALVHPADGWLVLGVLTAAGFAVLWPRRRRADAQRRAAALAAAVLTAVCAVAGIPAIDTLARAMRDPATSEQVFSQEALAGQWGFVNAHLFDALRTWREWAGRDAPDPAEEGRVRAYLARPAAVNAAAAARFGVARGDNLLLIQVESLQEWVIGAKVKGVEITPYLDSLRSKALFFPYVFDETGEGRSSDGEFEALNSEHALDRGAVAFRRPRNHFVALPGILRTHGYSTLSAHPFERSFWNRGILHPRYGIQRMLFRKALGPGEVIGWGLADGVFFERMVAPLTAEKQPFFAFLITLGLHHPFDLFPAQYKVLDVGALKGTPLGNYIHAMHYFDSSLASFMAALESKGLLANTVVAVYGDHESGLWVDDALLALAHQPRWDASVLVRLRRVPLFILVPHSPLAGEVRAIGGHVDIAPTLLALLGIPSPPCFVGHALDPGVRSIAVLNDGSVVGDGRVFVSEGPLIPAGGACFSWPDGAPLPEGECRGIEREGDEELEASRFVVIHDLAAKIAGFTPP